MSVMRCSKKLGKKQKQCERLVTGCALGEVVVFHKNPDGTKGRFKKAFCSTHAQSLKRSQFKRNTDAWKYEFKIKKPVKKYQLVDAY